MGRVFRALELLLAALLLAMVVMVFGNVVLRYVFNSGITASEELSRYCFVWLTFLGAVVAMRDDAHLGMSNMVELLPRTGKVVCASLSQVLIVACCVLLVCRCWTCQAMPVLRVWAPPSAAWCSSQS